MRDEHKAIKDWPWVQDHQLRNACPQPGESCHSWLSLHSSLIPVQEGPSVTWGRGKASGPLSTCMDGVDGGSAQDWRGRRLSVRVALTEQLTSEEVCWCQGHVPAVHRAAIPLRRGRHWWEPRDLLKASSYCKLAQRSLQSKKSLWFCIWHIYAPFLLGTSPSSLNASQLSEKCPEIQIHQRKERKARSLHATKYKPTLPRQACLRYISNNDCKIHTTLYQPRPEAREDLYMNKKCRRWAPMSPGL